MYNDKGNTKYLKLLKQNYSSSQDVIREIVNLSAIINLPKGTEFFLSDIHGEYEAFLHIMNNCSGVIKEKVDLIFKDTISDYDRQELCTLIYYPREKMALLDEQGKIDSDWYAMTLNQLILVAKLLSSKYTRSKVRKALPEEYAYIIDELLHAQEDEDANQVRYHKQILKTIIDLEDADEFIIALSALIKRLAVDHLHIVGDVFDRGGSADKILDLLYDYHSLDIEWGNHDILWMGAACGNDACICNVIRNNLKYNNVEILENAYGISLRQLMLFGMKTYGIEDGIEAARAAITVMLFKLEGQLILAHPEYEMGNRLMLDRLDELQDVGVDRKRFPTVDDERPYALSDEETVIMRKLHRQFVTGQRLHKHVRFCMIRAACTMYTMAICSIMAVFQLIATEPLTSCILMVNFITEGLCLTNVMRRQGLRMWTILIRMMWTLCGFCGEEKNHRCVAEGLRPLRWNMLQTRACGKSLLTHTTAGITIRASAVRYCMSSGFTMMMRIS